MQTHIIYIAIAIVVVFALGYKPLRHPTLPGVLGRGGYKGTVETILDAPLRMLPESLKVPAVAAVRWSHVVAN